MEKIYLTKNQFNKIKEQIFEIQAELKKLSEDIPKFASQGDLSENAEYQYAKERQRILFTRIDELNERLSRTVVINIAEEIPVEVGVGTTATLINLDTNKEEIYHIVGDGDFDFDKAEIPSSGPFASSFIGCRVNDEVKVTIPGGTFRYIIKDIKRYEN
ncbi:MAG: GreA/GreB family elongation factor [Candidatus Hydrogenedentota bacterium]